MAGISTLDFNSPDETRTPDKTKVDVVHVGNTTAARMAFEPGWKWSECVKPVAGTDSCQARHVGVVQSGTLRVTHDDGTEFELSPGEGPVACRHRSEHFSVEFDLVPCDAVVQALVKLPGNLAHLRRRGILSTVFQVTSRHLSSA